jgi:hypothetical protein
MIESLKEQFAKLTEQSFEGVPWQETIQQCQPKLCTTYQDAFRDKAKEFDEAGKPEAGAAARALQVVSLLHIRLDSPRQPFKDPELATGFYLPDVDDLGEPVLEVFARLAEEASDPEFKARLADVCWSTQTKRPFALVAPAIESYIASAENLTKPVSGEKDIDRLKRWEASALRLRRALQLAKMTKHQLLGEVRCAFDRALAQHISHMPLLELGSLLAGYQNDLDGDTTTLIKMASDCASRAEKESQWNHLRHFLRLKANWQKKAKLGKSALKTEERRAETYLKDGAANPTFRGKAHFAAKALTAYKQVSPKSPRIAAIKRLMDKHQRAGMSEMETVSYPVGLGIDPHVVVKHIANQPFPEALSRLAKIAPQMDETLIRKSLMERFKDPFAALASQDLIDWDGRVIAKRGSLISDDPKAVEEAIRAEMFRRAVEAQKAIVASLIEPARLQLISQHNPTQSDLYRMLVDSPFIPPGREYFFVRGLHEGLNGDFLVAAHLLVPQFEHTLRFHLENRGVDVTSFDQGIQEVLDLNKLFGFRRQNLVELFGTNQVFELEGLLVRRYGSNLRNSSAHGLFWPDQFFDTSVIYLWWVTLRLSLMHILQEPRLANPKPSARPLSRRSMKVGHGTHQVHSARSKPPKSKRSKR